MEIFIKEKFDSYPDHIRPLLLNLRKIIFAAATEYEVGAIEETLKWGEVSYVVKGGSTFRIDWKQKSPNQYFMFFHCQTTLIETFKEIYGDAFIYEGKRAIVFNISEQVPVAELKHCIALSLRYHRLKNLPLLGA
ncbi:MAG: hypothetical protein JWM78_40 [Verrucomicrobiaceae bacterium]|nr:hypothetical protein [Verrucomicrobiaceae bacterium]